MITKLDTLTLLDIIHVSLSCHMKNRTYPLHREAVVLQSFAQQRQKISRTSAPEFCYSTCPRNPSVPDCSCKFYIDDRC